MHMVRIWYASGAHMVRIWYAYRRAYRMRNNILRIWYAQSSLLMVQSTLKSGSTYPLNHPEVGQGSDGVPVGRYPDQGTTSTASTSMCRWSPAPAVNLKHLRDLRPQEGVGSQGYQVETVESRWPLRGVFRKLIESQGPS